MSQRSLEEKNVTKEDFWSVELGHGMGPFVLGLTRIQVVQILRELKLDTEEVQDNRVRGLYVDEIETMLVFSSDSLPLLKRIDVEDERLRFGPLEVLGKPVHEIVQLLKVPPSETLWCDYYEEEEQADGEAKNAKNTSDRDLVRWGTLWITSLGLGLSLHNGVITMVHLCDPEHSPRFGTGQWTKSQRLLSEVGERDETAEPLFSPRKLNPLSVLLNIGLIVAFGLLIWRAIELQKKWSEAPDVVATIIAVKPPPPEPFPDEATLSYSDTSGREHQVVFGRTDYYGIAKIGDEINIRFLPEEPEKPLGPSRFRDVGFDFALPYGIVILAAYSVLQLMISCGSFIHQLQRIFAKSSCFLHEKGSRLL